MTITSRSVRCFVIALTAVGLAACGEGLADGGLGGTEDAVRAQGAKGSCTRKQPRVFVDNTWAWGSPGSFGLKGQQLTYAIDVVNYDVGCGSSSFVVSLSAPDGFSVSMPATTISLKSAASGYLLASVTSPASIADGDYPLTVTVTRVGSADTASATSYYKVYSSDTVAPTLYWPSVSNGTTITARSYNIGVSSNDDHAVQKIELVLDGALVSTTACGGVSYSCQLTYTWATSPGQHTATFTAYDWLGNVAVLTSSFTVN